MAEVKVKICGLTRAVDVVSAAEAGANALGFVFARSPRKLGVEEARRLVESVPTGVLRVGLFMNQAAQAVHDVLAKVELDLLQFHGDEGNAFCSRFGLPFLKAVSMMGEDAKAALGAYPDAAGLLLDSHVPGGAGGTGKTFDWSQSVASDQPLWLAGGLNPDNVAEAVRQFQPYAVDVSSGVESAPGVKDMVLVHQFIRNARKVKA
ncbi:MAG: phosphoribosylanthranilate isomerase [Pseudomonadota bacterium]